MHTVIPLSPILEYIDTPKHVENATLLRNYSEDKLTTTWNPLPTLDINDTDPDILYTVELYQITCGQNILINQMEVAGSNVTEEGLDLMQIYKAVIAARNNVRDARNGPRIEMKGITVFFSEFCSLTRESMHSQGSNECDCANSTLP